MIAQNKVAHRQEQKNGILTVLFKALMILRRIKTLGLAAMLRSNHKSKHHIFVREKMTIYNTVVDKNRKMNSKLRFWLHRIIELVNSTFSLFHTVLLLRAINSNSDTLNFKQPYSFLIQFDVCSWNPVPFINFN